MGDKVDSGSRFIIGQHGGNFGMTPMAIHESHQIKIADKWLSWGWTDLNESKIVPVGNFKSKFGFKREKAPFVLTAQMAKAMGGKNSPGFALFIEYCCRGFNLIRKKSDHLISPILNKTIRREKLHP